MKKNNLSAIFFVSLLSVNLYGMDDSPLRFWSEAKTNILPFVKDFTSCVIKKNLDHIKKNGFEYDADMVELEVSPLLDVSRMFDVISSFLAEQSFDETIEDAVKDSIFQIEEELLSVQTTEDMRGRGIIFSVDGLFDNFRVAVGGPSLNENQLYQMLVKVVVSLVDLLRVELSKYEDSRESKLVEKILTVIDDNEFAENLLRSLSHNFSDERLVEEFVRQEVRD